MNTLIEKKIFVNICRNYMKKECKNKSCKFIHDPSLCRHFYRGNCRNLNNCNYSHIIAPNLINEFDKKDYVEENILDKPNPIIKNKNIIKKSVNKINTKIKNTETFKKDFYPPEMRVQFEYGQVDLKSKLTIQSNDVIIIPDLFSNQNDNNIYSKLLNEINQTKFDKEKLIHKWHEGCHLIVDDHYDWKKDCPTFNYVIDKIKKYFSMNVKATRFNIMEDLNDWKAFHHDGAAIKPEVAKKQNFTIGVSFGSTRDIAFQVANHKDCRNIVSFPLPSGTTYGFGKDINIDWRHGVLPIQTDSNYKPNPADGRISIVIWGWVEQIDVKPDNSL